jgi:hypothetical protein
LPRAGKILRLGLGQQGSRRTCLFHFRYGQDRNSYDRSPSKGIANNCAAGFSHARSPSVSLEDIKRDLNDEFQR